MKVSAQPRMPIKFRPHSVTMSLWSLMLWWDGVVWQRENSSLIQQQLLTTRSVNIWRDIANSFPNVVLSVCLLLIPEPPPPPFCSTSKIPSSFIIFQSWCFQNLAKQTKTIIEMDEWLPSSPIQHPAVDLSWKKGIWWQWEIQMMTIRRRRRRRGAFRCNPNCNWKVLTFHSRCSCSAEVYLS